MQTHKLSDSGYIHNVSSNDCLALYVSGNQHFFWFPLSAVGCQHSAVHQRQPVRAVCAHPDRTSPEEGLPAGSQLHRGATPHGGREREAGTGHLSSS